MNVLENNFTIIVLFYTYYRLKSTNLWNKNGFNKNTERLFKKKNIKTPPIHKNLDWRKISCCIRSSCIKLSYMVKTDDDYRVVCSVYQRLIISSAV